MISANNPDFTVCKQCGKRRTKDKSGLCCLCRRKKVTVVTCKICGRHQTSDPSGVCSVCRRAHASSTMQSMRAQDNEITGEYIDSLIRRSLDELSILRYYKDGLSLQGIGERVGMTRQQVAAILRKLIGARLFDPAHKKQELVLGEESGEILNEK